MKGHISIAFIALILLSTSAFSQVLRLGRDKTVEDLTKMPYVDLSDASRFQAAMTGTPEESKRAIYFDRPRHQLFNTENPAKSDSISSFTRYTYGAGYDSLPTKLADVIVTGRVVSETPHLSKHGTSVYTAFQCTPRSFLKGKTTA